MSSSPDTTDSGSSGEGMARNGLEKDYLLGLDNLRKLLGELHNELATLKRDFYHCDQNDDNLYETYAKNVNDKLLHCNSKLRKNNVKLEVVDSEIKLVELLNKIRQLDRVSADTVSTLTQYWQDNKDIVQRIQQISSRFQQRILKRLKATCVSYQMGGGGLTHALTQTYAQDVDKYQTTITQCLRGVDQLSKSFTSKIAQELLTNTGFSDRLLVSCDRKAFPVLRLVPDLSEKLVLVYSVARQWIDKDQTYVHDIGAHIRDARSASRRAEVSLREGRDRRQAMGHEVGDALKVFKTSREKLSKLEEEFLLLSEHLSQSTALRQYKIDERRQKEGMVGFLDISISQTKKNTSLQLKRARLTRQLCELEESLKELEKELIQLGSETEVKGKEKQLAEDEIQETSKAYRTLKLGLDNLSHRLIRLEKEVCELTGSLSQLEAIQTFKTSPENVEDFYDRPSTVRLAPSLQEKIRIRKRKLMNVEKSTSPLVR